MEAILNTEILILSGGDRVNIPVYKDIKDINKKYADLHTYSFKYYDKDDAFFAKDLDRPSNWDKIKHIRLYLEQDYKYILWIDDDALIINHTKTIENVFNLNKTNKNIFISPDINFLNTGVILIKNNQWTKDFFDKIIEIGRSDNFSIEIPGFNGKMYDYYEQNIINLLIFKNYNNALIHTEILPANIINSHLQKEYWGTPINENINYKKNVSFILHFGGMSDENRTYFLKKYKQEVIQ